MSSSLRPSGALLSPLMNAIKDAAASVILAVLMLGVLCARFFGQQQVSKEREPEPESHGSNVLANGAGCKDTDADASSVCINGGAETPVQACKSSHAASYPLENDFATDVSPTPPGQMLFGGMGPTPATPAPAHPAAMTVPARRTSAPPSPTNILPRNLEAVLLAVANSHADYVASRYTSNDTSANTDTTGAAANPVAQAPLPRPQDDDMDAEPVASIPALPVSTPPPPPPPPSNAKLGSGYLPDAAPTVPRRAPSASAAVPAAPRILTAPFEAAAAFGGDLTPPAHPSAAAPAFFSNGATGNNGCLSLGTFAAAATAAADTPTSSWPTRHDQMNALFREDIDGNGSDGHGSVAMAETGGAAVTAACGPNAWFAAAAADGAVGANGPMQDGGRAAADVEHHDGHNQQQKHKQQQQPGAARVPRTGLLAVPVVGLPATPSSPGLEGVTTEEGGDAMSGQGRALLRKEGGAGSSEVTNGAVEVVSPQAGAEKLVGVVRQQQQQLPASPPAGTPVAALTARNLSKTFVAAGAVGVGTAANGTPQLKGRGTSGPKQPQQQPTRGAGGGATLKSSGNTAASPRAVASSAKQKRGMTSPTAAGAATTPATARRPVGLDSSIRSPRSGVDKNPVARKLNPTSPKPDASSEAVAAAAAGQDGGNVSPVSQPSLRMCDMSAASGFLPRYAAPTAASIARQTQPLPPPPPGGTPHRSNTQKLLLAVGMSIGADAGGVGVGGEVGGAAVGATPRRGAHEAQLRYTVSSGALGI